MTSPLRHPVQIAYAVPNRVTLERHAEEFRVATGTGPFVVVEHVALEKAAIHGATGRFDHSSAYGQWGHLMVELIQEHTPPVVETGTAIHHLAFFVDDLDDAIDWCERRGWPIVLDATTVGGQRFVFADARPERGHLIEMYEPNEKLLGFYEHVRRLANG